MRIFYFVVSFLVAVSGFGKDLTLEEAVQFALEHSPVFDSVRRGVDVADLQKRVAFETFLPALTFSTTDGFVGNQPPGATDPYSTSVAFNLAENLYDNGASLTQYKISKDALGVNQLKLLKARDQLCLDVSNSFYQFSLQTKLLQIKKEQLTTLNKQMSLVNSQYQQGFKTKKDYLRLKAQVQRTEIDLLSEQNDIENSINDLRRLLGQGPESPEAVNLQFAAMEPGSAEPATVTGAVKIDQFYDFKINQLQSDANERAVDLARRNYWPQFTLELSAAYTNTGFYGPQGGISSSTNTVLAPVNVPAGTVSGNEQYGWSALLTVSYNLLDWGILKNKVEIAESTKLVQDDTMRDGLLSSGNDIKDNELQLRRLYDSYKLQKELLDSETQSYEILRYDYKEGKIPFLDMITALNDLLDAKVNFATIYFELFRDVARFHFYEGTLYEKIMDRLHN